MSLPPQARCTLRPFPFLCSLTSPCTSPPFSPLWLASSSLPSHSFCVFTTSSPAAQTFSASYTNFAHSCWLHKIVLPISVHITASPSRCSHVVRCSSLSFASFILIPLCRYPLSLAHTASLTGWFISRHHEFSLFSGYQQLTEIYHRSITDLSTENTVFPLGRGSACFSFPHSQAWATTTMFHPSTHRFLSSVPSPSSWDFLVASLCTVALVLPMSGVRRARSILLARRYAR